MPKGIHNGNRGGNHQKSLKERFDNAHQKTDCENDCWIRYRDWETQRTIVTGKPFPSHDKEHE